MQNIQPRIICVDFDGTVVTHDFPEVGKPLAFAGSVLQDLAKHGHKLILWTMRSGEYLDAAIKWFEERNIPLWGVNENPEQLSWSQSPKAYAQIYIDDAALGCPVEMLLEHDRPAVNWFAVRSQLIDMGVLPNYGEGGAVCESVSGNVNAEAVPA